MSTEEYILKHLGAFTMVMSCIILGIISNTAKTRNSKKLTVWECLAVAGILVGFTVYLIYEITGASAE